MLCKQGLQFGVTHGVAQVADIQIHAHKKISKNKGLNRPDRGGHGLKRVTKLRMTLWLHGVLRHAGGVGWRRRELEAGAGRH